MIPASMRDPISRNWPNTYVDDMRGKIVISQLYCQVKAMKSGRRCRNVVGKHSNTTFNPPRGGAIGGLNQHVFPVSMRENTSLAAFLLSYHHTSAIYNYLAPHVIDVCIGPNCSPLALMKRKE